MWKNFVVLNHLHLNLRFFQCNNCTCTIFSQLVIRLLILLYRQFQWFILGVTSILKLPRETAIGRLWVGGFFFRPFLRGIFFIANLTTYSSLQSHPHSVKRSWAFSTRLYSPPFRSGVDFNSTPWRSKNRRSLGRFDRGAEWKPAFIQIVYIMTSC